MVSLLNEIQSVGCDLYIHQLGIDTATPSVKSVRAITSLKKWGEIDSESDLVTYQKLLDEGMFPWIK